MTNLSNFARRASFALLMIGLIAATGLLSGCFDKEPEQRAAFIEVLQKNILEKKGSFFSISKEQEKNIGPYAEHLKFLSEAVDANQFIDQFNNMNQLQQKMERNNDLQERDQLIAQISQTLAESSKATQAELEKAKAGRAALKQPDDLKQVYDAAFNKLVVNPLEILHEVFNKAGALVDSAKALNDYAMANPAAVEVKGNTYEIKKAAAQKELQALIKGRNDKLKDMNESIRKLNSIR